LWQAWPHSTVCIATRSLTYFLADQNVSYCPEKAGGPDQSKGSPEGPAWIPTGPSARRDNDRDVDANAYQRKASGQAVAQSQQDTKPAKLTTNMVCKRGWNQTLSRPQFLVDTDVWIALEWNSRAPVAKEYFDNCLREFFEVYPECKAALALTKKHEWHSLLDRNDDVFVQMQIPANIAAKPWIHLKQEDCLHAAQAIHRQFPDVKISVLNTASVFKPGGKFFQGSITQEESFCYRTTLLPCLKKEFYVPKLDPEKSELITSPKVRVHSLEPGLLLPLDEQFDIGVVSIAAINSPVLTKDGSKEYAVDQQRQLMFEKIYEIFDASIIALGATQVVVSAFGCGIYKNPPKEVAIMMEQVLTNFPWRQRGITDVTIAIKDTDNSDNFRIFSETFEDSTGVDIDIDGEDIS
jgi:uncharacterized protein (TIGR02452 family)